MAYSSTLSGYRRTLGAKGEEAVIDFLIDKGHHILGTNVFNKYGEVDIISHKDNIIYFIEVKTVKGNSTTPEEHMDWRKIRKTSKLAQLIYNDMLEKRAITDSTDYVLALACVRYALDGKLLKIEFIEGIEV